MKRVLMVMLVSAVRNFRLRMLAMPSSTALVSATSPPAAWFQRPTRRSNSPRRSSRTAPPPSAWSRRRG